VARLGDDGIQLLHDEVLFRSGKLPDTFDLLVKFGHGAGFGLSWALAVAEQIVRSQTEHLAQERERGGRNR